MGQGILPSRLLAERLLAPADSLPQPLTALAQSLDSGGIADLVETLQSRAGEVARPEVARRLMQVIGNLASRSSGLPGPAGGAGQTERLVHGLKALYLATPAELPLACGWLMWLGGVPGNGPALAAWADLLGSRPPGSLGALSWAVAPLLRRQDLPSGLLARVLDQTLANPVVAPAILDLCNFRFREKIDDAHAASPLLDRLARLLLEAVRGLQRIEEGHLPPGSDAAAISQNINHLVALVVGLCDAAGQCRFQPAEGALRQALELRHRRIQTEAAAALAQLDVAMGREALVRLAGEPAARLRALAYLGELGLLDEVPSEHRSDRARAESQLATWLAEPGQMGIAPARMELVDQRPLVWPGNEEAVECYLFRFHYGERYSGVGLAGPAVGLVEGAGDWMLPNDMFAAAAGALIDHEELFSVPAERFREEYPGLMARLLAQAEEAGFSAAEPALAGNFFGTWILLAGASRNGHSGWIAIADDVRWYPAPEGGSLDPQQVWRIESGRRVLAWFNPAAGF